MTVAHCTPNLHGVGSVGVATMTSKRAVVRGVLCAWLVGCATAAVRAHVPAGPDVVLVHAFRDSDWRVVEHGLDRSIRRRLARRWPRRAAGDRRGTARRVALAGGRRGGWPLHGLAPVERPCHPCGFSLRDIDLGRCGRAPVFSDRRRPAVGDGCARNTSRSSCRRTENASVVASPAATGWRALCRFANAVNLPGRPESAPSVARCDSRFAQSRTCWCRRSSTAAAAW